MFQIEVLDFNGFYTLNNYFVLLIFLGNYDEVYFVFKANTCTHQNKTSFRSDLRNFVIFWKLYLTLLVVVLDGKW
jgi:hypothetical protein